MASGITPRRKHRPEFLGAATHRLGVVAVIDLVEEGGLRTPPVGETVPPLVDLAKHDGELVGRCGHALGWWCRMGHQSNSNPVRRGPGAQVLAHLPGPTSVVAPFSQMAPLEAST